MTSVSTMLITGGAGFVGSAFCRAALEQTPRRVVVFDALTYAGRRENLDGLEQTYRDRFAFMHGDIRDREAVTRAVALWSPDVIVNLAAESHVDRSIQSAGVFVATNVTGVQTLVDVVRSASPATKFIQVSTDEVYGALPLDDPSARFTEQSPLAPRSPYAASKAGGDCLALAAHHTHGLDVVVTRCANNMGPRQFPEKLVPRFITRLLEGKPVPVYGDGRHVRDWMHVDDHADGLLRVIERGTAGGVYHLGAGNEISNLDLTHALLEVMDIAPAARPSLVEHVRDRPGHDERYALDASRSLAELGWTPTRSSFPGMLESTVRWYRENEDWWRSLLPSTASG